MHVTGGMFEPNGTNSMPKSVPRLVVDKVKLLNSSEIYSQINQEICTHVCITLCTLKIWRFSLLPSPLYKKDIKQKQKGQWRLLSPPHYYYCLSS